MLSPEGTLVFNHRLICLLRDPNLVSIGVGEAPAPCRWFTSIRGSRVRCSLRENGVELRSSYATSKVPSVKLPSAVGPDFVLAAT